MDLRPHRHPDDDFGLLAAPLLVACEGLACVSPKQRKLGLVGGGVAAATALTTFVAGAGVASNSVSGIPLPSVRAQHKTPGVWSANVLSPELAEVAVAHGSRRLENGTQQIPYYGYLGDGPLVPIPPDSNTEATKTDPDKNTYLVLDGQTGADGCSLCRSAPSLSSLWWVPSPGM